MDFAKNFTRLRKQKNITQEEVGQVLGVSTAAVSKWETANSIPDIYMLGEIADYFEVTTDELLGRNIQKKRVAIVDDVKFMRDTIERILTDNNCTVVLKAENGKELLEHKNLHKAEFLILNVNMPVMDGFETLKAIKEKNLAMKIVMCSADDSIETIDKAMALGANDYLVKPFKDGDLLELVKN